MPKFPNSDSKERMALALGEFLASPPVNLPADLIEAFGPTVRTNDGILPPRVFFEAVEQSSVATSITDTKANIIYANSAFQKLTGYQPEEVVGKNQSILSYKVTPIAVYKELWGCLLKQKSWNGVLINKRKDGERYLADLTVAPVLGNDGQTCYYLALHRDVTEVHELEQKVRNQKVLIESVVDAAPVVMVLLNSEGKIMLDNHEYKKLLGDMRGQEPLDIFMASLEEVIAYDKKLTCKERQGFRNREIGFRNQQGIENRWFSCSGVWVNEKNITADNYFVNTEECYLLLVANEITQHKRQQNQIKTNAMRALMAEQQLTHGIRETLSGAIYQLQSQINMASAVAGMMERRQDNGELKSFQSAMQDIVKSGSNILESLQHSLPGEDKESVSLVNMNEVIKDVIDLSIYQLLEKSVLVDWAPETNLPNISGQFYALRTLFKQLLDNAIDALDEPGCTRREIHIQTKYVKNDVVISIRDTGPGIEANKKHLVFEPFYSGWLHIKGRPGMGLTIALQIVQKHFGVLEIDTANIGGGHITIKLPIHPPHSGYLEDKT